MQQTYHIIQLSEGEGNVSVNVLFSHYARKKEQYTGIYFKVLMILSAFCQGLW